jgi:hypothetical protein
VGQPDAKWRSATRLTLNLGRLAAASKKDPSGECGAARAIQFAGAFGGCGEPSRISSIPAHAPRSVP